MPKPKFLTPSSFKALMSTGRNDSGWGLDAMRVVERLALDILGVEPPEEVTNRALEWGITWENSAIRRYERETMSMVKRPSFKVHPRLPFVGGTADGLVGKVGGIEAKCPYNPINHIRRSEQSKEYEWQVYGYMAIHELEWIDLLSFDPRFPAWLQLIINRVERDEEKVEQLEARCIEAHEKALEIVEQTRRAYAQ